MLIERTQPGNTRKKTAIGNARPENRIWNSYGGIGPSIDLLCERIAEVNQKPGTL
jgi:hypothetical protein